MVADILIGLGKANLAAGAAILLVLIARKTIRRLFGARIAYSLWLAAPLAAVAVLLPARTIFVEALSAPATQDSITPMPEASVAFLGLWAAGFALSIVVLAWRQSRFVAGLGHIVRDGEYLRASAPGVGPAVVGALFPRIVIPADFESRFDPREQEVVLAHETAHLASGDALVNAFTALVQCLCWFNPLVHIAAHQLRIDQELACDAAVLAARPRDRRAYAQALLKTQLTTTSLPLGCFWPASHGNPLKERIAMLKSPSPSRARILVGVSGIALLCLGASFASWAAQPADIIEVVSQEVPADVLIEVPGGAAGPIAITRVPRSEVSGTVTRKELSSGEMRTVIVSNSPAGSGELAEKSRAFRAQASAEGPISEVRTVSIKRAATAGSAASGAAAAKSFTGAKPSERRQSVVYITAAGERKTIPASAEGGMTIQGSVVER